MHLHFEKTVNVKSDCTVLSLSWMGRVPDEMPEGDGWKLNRSNYYQEGWLATGNLRGNVGITYTTSSCKRNSNIPLRANYNLRGHRPGVVIVKWNEPYQKLASCDSSGIIFVWIKYEGRWSIELINDRNTAVTHFSWSHDGRMALICYQDGFVLVGSVAGQRYWSSLLNGNATTTCGVWTPDDQQVYLSTNTGQIIIMDVHGAMVSQVQLQSGVGISSMSWSCEKFKMEEDDNNDEDHLLAVCFENGLIYFIKSFEDVSPIQLDTSLNGTLCVEWSNSKDLLAVAGNEKSSNLATLEYCNALKFYNKSGTLVCRAKIPHTQAPVTAVTWGHNDKRIFIATGAYIHIAWVSNNLPTLQLLCGFLIRNSIYDEKYLSCLQLPPKICFLVENLYTETIQCCVPKPTALRQFVCSPATESTRLHCTMIKQDNLSSSGSIYTLYLEYLGGLLPILKGKRISKLKPEFVIFDPEIDDNSKVEQPCNEENTNTDTKTDGRDNNTIYIESRNSFPNSPRKRKKNVHKLKRTTELHRSCGTLSTVPVPNNSCNDTSLKKPHMVEVTSNIWGTKFRFQGFVNNAPINLGYIAYKTSLLHLQPRQMTLVITELLDGSRRSHSSDDENCYSVGNNDQDLTSLCGASITSKRDNLARESNLRYLKLLKKHVSSRDEPPEAVTFKARNFYTAQSPEKWCNPHTFAVGNRCRNNENNNKFRHAMASDGENSSLQSPKNAVAPCDLVEVSPTYSSFCFPGSDDLNGKCGINAHLDSETPTVVDSDTGGLLSVATLYDHTRTESPVATKAFENSHYLGTYRILSCDEDATNSVTVSNKSTVRSCSMGYLDLAQSPIIPSDTALIMLQKDIPKPLVLSKFNNKRKEKNSMLTNCTETNAESNSNLKTSGKSKSLDSYDVFGHPLQMTSGRHNIILKGPCDAALENAANHKQFDADIEQHAKTNKSTINTQLLSTFANLKTKLKISEWSKSVTKRLSRSSPATPVVSRKDKRPLSASPVRKKFFMSPSLIRRSKQKNIESSEDESPADEFADSLGDNYKNLEAFQKTLLKQKLRKGKSNVQNFKRSNNDNVETRKIVMHNKEPIWNENSQVYQLDFGGRVTQESAKNFQIEYNGKQVMQFGRIDSDVYTLDFQYPFTSLQAFAVALANVTQRLK